MKAYISTSLDVKNVSPMSTESLERRIETLDEHILTLSKEVAAGFARTEEAVKSLNEYHKDNFTRMEKEISEVKKMNSSNFKWTAGLVCGVWLSLIVCLLPISLKILGWI